MKHLALLTLSLSIPFLLSAQFSQSIRTARPGQAIGAYALGAKVFQIQSGLTYNPYETGVSKIKSTAHTTVLRFGIIERIELSGVIVWQTDDFELAGGGESKASGVSNTQIGGRINLLQQRDAIPTVGIQGRLLLRAQSDEYQRDKLGSKIVLAIGEKLTNWASVLTNFGLQWAGDGGDAVSLYVLNLSFPLSNNWGAFIEVYGGFDAFTANFDTGFSYLVNNDFQLDFSGGWQGRDGLSNWFLDAGVSWRVHWRDE